MDLIIGVTGASGTIYAVKLLEALKERKEVVTHVIFSDYAWINLRLKQSIRKRRFFLWQTTATITATWRPVSPAAPIRWMAWLSCRAA